MRFCVALPPKETTKVYENLLCPSRLLFKNWKIMCKNTLLGLEPHEILKMKKPREKKMQKKCVSGLSHAPWHTFVGCNVTTESRWKWREFSFFCFFLPQFLSLNGSFYLKFKKLDVKNGWPFFLGFYKASFFFLLKIFAAD